MRLPDFVLSMDCLAVIRITEPSFELRQVTQEELPDLPSPQVWCELRDGRKFAVVKWLGDPDVYKPDELDLFARRGIEYLLGRWDEEGSAEYTEQ